MTVNKRHLC